MRILIVVLLTLYIYLPFIPDSFNSIDDRKMVNSLLNTRHIDYSGLFFPQSRPYYYRPLLYLSFLFDQRTHMCSAYLMHLENVIIHLFNTLLIIMIAKELFSPQLSWPVYWLTPIIFAIHPINTEAVNWVSARTDLLAGFFSFLAFLLLLRSHGYVSIFLSGVSFLLGLLCKESAIGFIGFAFVFVLYLHRNNLSLKQKSFFVAVFVLAVVTYFMMRYPELRFWSHKQIALDSLLPQGGKKQYSTDTSPSIIYSIGVLFKVIGFYFKKLFVPWPLNFAIVRINRSFYLFLGIAITGLLIFLLIKERNGLALSLLWSLCFMLIATLVPLRRLAWTPLAERYIYISSFGMCLFVTYVAIRLAERYDSKRIIYCGLGIYLLAFCISTAYRNYIWKDNYRLYIDTVKKSPDFGPVHNELGIALLDKGKKEEAKKEFEIAARLTKGCAYNLVVKNNALMIEQGKLKPEEVLRRYDSMMAATDDKDVKANIIHNGLRYMNYLLLNNKVTPSERRFIYKKKIEYFKKLSALQDRAFCNYKLGQLYLAMGKRDKAYIYFKKAYHLADKDAFFKKAAYNLIKRLEDGGLKK